MYVCVFGEVLCNGTLAVWPQAHAQTKTKHERARAHTCTRAHVHTCIRTYKHTCTQEPNERDLSSMDTDMDDEEEVEDQITEADEIKVRDGDGWVGGGRARCVWLPNPG